MMVLALTDVWLGHDTDQLIMNQLIRASYKFNHIPRTSGIGILYKFELADTMSIL